MIPGENKAFPLRHMTFQILMSYLNRLASLNSHHGECHVSPCKCISLQMWLEEEDETFLSQGDFNSIRSLTRRLESTDEFLDIKTF